MNKKVQIAKYVGADFLSASLVWALFNILRYDLIASFLGYRSLGSYLSYKVVWEVQLLVPFYWLVLYYFSGYYNKAFGKSRLGEFSSTLVCVLLGAVLLFFIVILDDLPSSFHIYYELFFSLLGMQFFFTYIPRLLITRKGLRKIKNREWAVNALIIGVGPKAKKIAAHLHDTGYHIFGFVSADDKEELAIPPEQMLGALDRLPDIVPAHQIGEIVVAVESEDSDERVRILYLLYRYNCPIKILADKSNMLTKVKIKTIRDLPLIDVTDNSFSEPEKNIKLWLDRFIAALAMILLSPAFVYIMWRVRRDSPGSIIFRQERIGYRGKPFMMYKFRTMYEGSEDDGPLLAVENDRRITPFGHLMRKYRLDELPQFWNVLKGDMSLVGPRPERRYFIDQIVKKAPYYYLLHNVRPGVTSLGMVKYGYASNVEEMIERLEYDMLYYENMSLAFDMTILVYTVKTVITGKGI
jgi:exopolysaccharide biosynthesis polyprenyl glycosylphosphotransferase